MTAMRGLRRRVGRATVFAILSVVAVVMLYPFYFMTETSFRSYAQYLSKSGYSLDSWTGLVKVLPVVQQLVNSTLVTVSAVLIILVVSSMGGYAFAKLRYPGRPVILVMIIGGMMIPLQSVIIPEFVNVAQLGLINQYQGAMIVYAALGAPFATFLMTTYFRGIPSELIEASLIDGASYLQTFVRVMLPLAAPALVTVAVLQFIQIWDDLLVGLLFLQTPSVRTITVGLATLQSSRIIDVPILMAGSLVSALPAVIVYVIFQRYLIAGLTMGMGR
jgi:multiple sugar transport system permease protein/raffinose/stachyose/melibiose transport system permease protein